MSSGGSFLAKLQQILMQRMTQHGIVHLVVCLALLTSGEAHKELIIHSVLTSAVDGVDTASLGPVYAAIPPL